MLAGRGLGTYHVNKKHGGWTSCGAIGQLGKLLSLFGQEGDIFFFWLLQHPHFVRETSNQHPYFFPRCSSGGSTMEARMQLKEKHKYRPKNLIRFHLQGCSCVLKRPPTRPTSKDIHCNHKRFGNLPPSFRSLSFFLGSITVKSLAL